MAFNISSGSKASFAHITTLILISHSGTALCQDSCDSNPFPTRVFYAGEQGSVITNGDIDNDGDEDVLVSNCVDEDDFMRVMLNEQGTLILQDESYPISSYTKCRLVDLNGDGILDFLNPRYNSQAFELRFGMGNSIFGDRILHLFPVTYNSNFEVVDLDNDGDLDVIGVGELTGNNKFVYRLNDGKGGFDNSVTIPNDFGAYGFSACDMNNDGFIDLVTADRGGQSISVRLSSGDLSFKDPIRVAAGEFPREIDIHDIDQDGDLDVAAAVLRDETINIFMNDGSGTLTRIADVVPGFAVGYRVRLHDLDNDGYPEIMAANDRNDEAAVFSNLSGNGFKLSQHLFTRLDLYSTPFSDFNGDSHPDLLVNTQGDFEGVGYLTNDGTGVFRTFMKTPLFDIDLAGFNFRGDFEYADTNNDGISDFSYCINSLRSIFRIQNDDSGNFTALDTIQTQWEPSFFKVVDTNSDGVLDIAYISEENESLNIMLGLDNGTFLPEIPSPAGYSTGDITAAHLNDDPYIDLVIPLNLSNNSQNISVYFGSSNGFIFDQVSLPTNTHPYYAVCGDIDNDGDIDILGGRSQDYSIDTHVFINNGNRTFTELDLISSGSHRLSDIKLVDVNGDTLLDLVSANSLQERISIRYGNGDGTFASATWLPAGPATDIEVGDMNLDGVLDLVSANSSGETISLYTGDGGGKFNERITFHGGPVPRDIQLGDFDGDGLLDIAGVNSEKGTLSLHIQSCQQQDCPVDFNDDGVLNFFDVSAFLIMFSEMNSDADLNSDNTFNFFDVAQFIQDFLAGCK